MRLGGNARHAREIGKHYGRESLASERAGKANEKVVLANFRDCWRLILCLLANFREKKIVLASLSNNIIY
jgi:hypothetical protein